MKRKIATLLMILPALLMTACKDKSPSGATPSNEGQSAVAEPTLDTQILGKWMLGPNSYEFFKDGSVVFIDPKQGNMNGRWVTAGGNRVKIDYTGMLGVSVTYIFAEIQFTGNTMMAFEETNKARVTFTKG